VLFAFGGMGPVHALDVASELGITRVVIPPLPGLFSALGLLFADVEHHLVRTHYADIARLDHDRLNASIGELHAEAVRTLDREGYDAAHRSIALSVDTRYAGQDYALEIPLRRDSIDPAHVAALAEDFHREHEKTYGYRSEGEDVQIVALRCLGRGLGDGPKVPGRLGVQAIPGWARSAARRCYFGAKHGWIETDVLGRFDLAGRTVVGPAIIEEDNSLTVVLPDWRATLDDWSNIVLDAT
jgi:N-methylhydantoinase A